MKRSRDIYTDTDSKYYIGYDTKITNEKKRKETILLRTHYYETNNSTALKFSLKELFAENKFDGWNNDKVAQFQEILKSGVCNYERLHKLFIKNMNYIFYVHDEPICGTVVSTEYEKGFFPCFRVTYSYYTYSSKKDLIVKEKKSVYKYAFSGNQTLEELRCEILTEEMKIRLTARGEKYLKYCRNFHHVDYQGALLIPKWGGAEKILTKGRVMIDHTFYENTESRYHRYSDDDEDSFNSEDIPKHKLNAFLGCYDLTKHRRWGLSIVENIFDIDYNDDAFACLTLNETLDIGNKKMQVKDLVKDLVKSKDSVNFDDIIEGKSCGMIFLLHGPPGVGKTLTAEATAEVLHIPLYYLSAGELGSKSEDVEEGIKKVLELTKRWNAITLIDEADVFLEKRETSNLKRNAVVSIFLKYLESHTGIVFLTSNRVGNIDNAFLSRISLVLNYDEFTPEIRKEIWINLLRASNIDPDTIDVDSLIKYDLNGRQIKNIIKLAQCIAVKDEEKCSTQHIISLCNYFEKHHKLDGAKNYC